MIKVLILCLFILTFSGCENIQNKDISKHPSDFLQIQKSGKLTAITGYSATNYFIFHGKPMGYEYELLQRLADHLNLKLDMVIAEDMDQIFDMLLNGQGDIIAHSMAITKERRKIVSFTQPHMYISMVLIQRRPENWRKMMLHQIEAQLIRNPVDLIGKEIHVRQGSSYSKRLINMSEEIGGDILIIPAPGNQATEQLIKMVSTGEIDYTVADENIAQVNQAFLRNIDIDTPVSFPQQIAWAVRKDSPVLLDSINVWLEEIKNEPDFYVIYNKYYKNRTAFKNRVKSDFFSGAGGNISKWDSTIQVQSDRIGWDWRLLASQIYQESRFDPKAKSWAGAQGLMQLMPETAAELGIRNLRDPEKSITAGVNYLIWLENFWKKEIPDSLERKKFILGSYNVGYNHIRDSRKLAKKYNRKPNVWNENVAYYLEKKSEKEFFNDEVVEFGYCRGSEPVKYVAEIFDRYEHYLKLLE